MTTDGDGEDDRMMKRVRVEWSGLAFCFCSATFLAFTRLWVEFGDSSRHADPEDQAFQRRVGGRRLAEVFPKP